MISFNFNYIFKDSISIYSHKGEGGLGIQCMNFGGNTIQSITITSVSKYYDNHL